MPANWIEPAPLLRTVQTSDAMSNASGQILQVDPSNLHQVGSSVFVVSRCRWVSNTRCEFDGCEKKQFSNPRCDLMVARKKRNKVESRRKQRRAQTSPTCDRRTRRHLSQPVRSSVFGHLTCVLRVTKRDLGVPLRNKHPKMACPTVDGRNPAQPCLLAFTGEPSETISWNINNHPSLSSQMPGGHAKKWHHVLVG